MGTRPDILFATSKPQEKIKIHTYEDWLNVLKSFQILRRYKKIWIKIN